MMNEMNNVQSTTEELIVAYLDGELVRKELEIMLFDRLAGSAEARTLLREHLVMRGAIKASLTDDRFQLSDDLDTRTRARLEQILKSVSTPAVVAAARSKRAANAPAIAYNAAERRLQQWIKRPVALALLLLLAVGTTWYTTRVSMNGAADQQIASNDPAVKTPEVITQQEPTQSSSITPATPASSNEKEPKVIVRTVVQKVYVKSPSKAIAQNASNSSSKNGGEAAGAEDVMLSDRAKAKIKNTNTIIVTEDDRI